MVQLSFLGIYAKGSDSAHPLVTFLIAVKKKYLTKSTKGSRLFSFMIIQSTVACNKSHREPTVKKQREINASGQHQGIGCGNFREDQK